MNTSLRTAGVKSITPENISSTHYDISRASKRELLTAATLLERGEAALDEFGWIRGSMGSTGQGFCTLGALNHAKRTSKFKNKEQCRQLAERALNLSVTSSVVNFNDSRARDRRVIKKWMRKTAERLRELAAK